MASSPANIKPASTSVSAPTKVESKAPSATGPLDPQLYINRELSWLEFNQRVLAEADNPAVPLFERLKFLGIFSNNLDEFFMVRVAGLMAQLSSDVIEISPDGMNPSEQLKAISKRAHELLAEQYRIWNQTLAPSLAKAGVEVLHPSKLRRKLTDQLDEKFRSEILPVLTPIVIDPAHPFPHLRNKGINVGVRFRRQDSDGETYFGVVQVPSILPRLIEARVDGEQRCFVTLDDLVIRHLGTIFPNTQILAEFAFRVTRNFDIQIDDDEAEDLLLTLQAELRRRERGDAVRLELSGTVPKGVVKELCDQLELDRRRDVYDLDGPLFLADMNALVAGDDRKEYRDEPFAPLDVPPMRDSDDLFQTIREGDVLLQHPYESFEAVIDFLSVAAEDPDVLAIKMTLYRTGGESPMVRTLQRAAELGKQVTALVELKARFDEESNIRWARTLERSGVNVMYGLLGMKLHAKVLMVVRREGQGLRRYVHLATGNYNEQTARLYADVSLFTSRDDIGEDATSLFNLLTSYSTPPKWNQLIVAPLGLHEAVLGLIHREIDHAQNGRPAGIVAKMNSLVDADVIAALYAASRAGVPIELLVRGICCLRPGVPGQSENIRVHAVVDRFLEHARIFHFRHGGADEVFCSSADWMPRNFRRRVEVMYPILDASIKQRILGEILGTMRADDVKGWLLRPDGRYARVEPGANAPLVRSQKVFMDTANERAHEVDRMPSLAGLRPEQRKLEELRPSRKKKKGPKRKRRKHKD